MPATEQTDLWDLPRMALDPAPKREISKSQGNLTCDAQAEPAGGRSPPQILYPRAASHSRVSLGDGHHHIPIPGKMLYMCTVLDLCGKAVLAWKMGADRCFSLVTDTIRETLQREKVTDALTLHSDQGFQYTSQTCFDLTQAYHVSPSVFSSGCPYDNAAMESFFGTLKTECLYRSHFTTRAEVKQLVAEYVDFCNFERSSLKNGLIPVEIRSKTA